MAGDLRQYSRQYVTQDSRKYVDVYSFFQAVTSQSNFCFTYDKRLTKQLDLLANQKHFSL